MKRFISILTVILLFGVTSCMQDDFTSDPNLDAQSLKNGIINTLPGGAEYEISIPPDWETQDPKYIIFYAHGLQDPGEAAHLPYDELIAGRTVKELVNEMGFGYAATSYREDGFVADLAVADMLELRSQVLIEVPGAEDAVLIIGGPSEGGLVTALTLETPNHGFDGGLSICGPIGDFYKQIQYNGDFHVLFNYFFGADLASLGYSTGSPLGIGEDIMNEWRAGVLPHAVEQVLTADALNGCKKLKQLFKCANVTVDLNDPEAMGIVAVECLRYNIMITDDMIARLGGVVPFYNKYKWYRGSNNDWRLNRYVDRIYVDSYNTGKSAVQKYQTSGHLDVPFVTIHTTGDHVTPFFHNPAYRLKALFGGSSLLHTGIPVDNYGHCTIEESHVVAGLGILFVKIGLMDLFAVDHEVFSTEESIEGFKQIMSENSVEFEITN